MCVATFSGCAVVDTVVWGSDGAQVIQTTEKLIQGVASDGTSDLVCEDFDAGLGTAAHWADRTAGEPERFFADFWEDQAQLDPQWSINVEGRPESAVPGDTFPGDVFYRETDEKLCVIDVAWTTLG